jgi:glycosyltransferase involved in cell wall biosynthesis
MVDLAGDMHKRGLRVRIVVPDLPTTAVAEARAAKVGVDILRTPLIRADAWGSRQNLLNLLKLFRQNTARLYHLHTGDVCLPRFALLTMNLLELRPMIVTTHSPYATLARGSARARHWAHAVGRKIDMVVCPSDHSRELQIAYGVPPQKVTTIRNSVDVEWFGSGDPSRAYEALGLDRSHRLLIFTSRLDAQKRPEDAVRIFQRIADEFPDVHLVMAGQGAAEAGLREMVESAGIGGRVHFPGYQSNVPDWLAAAAVWVFPTESENFSLALLEALSAGCPIVSTACQGNDEVLVNEINAMVSPVGNVDSMAAAVRRILSEPELERRLRAEARKTVESYTLSNMADRYAACYNDSLGVLVPPWEAAAESA